MDAGVEIVRSRSAQWQHCRATAGTGFGIFGNGCGSTCSSSASISSRHWRPLCRCRRRQGASRELKLSHTPGYLRLLPPLANVPEAGSSSTFFSLWPAFPCTTNERLRFKRAADILPDDTIFLFLVVKDDVLLSPRSISPFLNFLRCMYSPTLCICRDTDSRRLRTRVPHFQVIPWHYPAVTPDERDGPLPQGSR